ncbi:EAL domain-containing protein [Granulicella sp. WH15]|uniref:EAL domain-containing protein n=1 Tax=Granulicella sp. WH15 TaxID=2602070 RepID=UPI00136706A9|nr:EAL domain-containing protein [Granulicella sp. WH15]QHN02955.1 EAL domain-containing protein [Granulicella sp. WH15]
MSNVFACPTVAGAPSLPDFVIAFQPIVDVCARRVVAYEALTRTMDGACYPKLIDGMDEKTLRRFDREIAIEAIRRAVELGLKDLDVSLCLNLRPDLHPEALDAEYLRLAAGTCGLSPSEILLEMTEEHKLAVPELHSLLERNQAAGFYTGVDDFGAGYSGLAMLVECRPEILKLDRSLVRGIDSSDRRQKIVAAFAQIAESMKTSLIAEGVETVAEYEKLRELGIRFMQGYLFASPSVEELPWQAVWGVMPPTEAKRRAGRGAIAGWLAAAADFDCGSQAGVPA